MTTALAEQRSRTIFDITGDMEALEALLYEAGGDISDPKVAEAVEAWEKELAQDLHGKVDAYIGLMRELESRASARKDEAGRLMDRARSDERAASNLKERLKYVFERLGVTRLETRRFAVSVAGNGGKQAIDIDIDIPDDYQIMVPKPDAERIREELESGRALPFARLVPRGTHLRIR